MISIDKYISGNNLLPIIDIGINGTYRIQMYRCADFNLIGSGYYVECYKETFSTLQTISKYSGTLDVLKNLIKDNIITQEEYLEILLAIQ